MASPPVATFGELSPGRFWTTELSDVYARCALPLNTAAAAHDATSPTTYTDGVVVHHPWVHAVWRNTAPPAPPDPEARMARAFAAQAAAAQAVADAERQKERDKHDRIQTTMQAKRLGRLTAERERKEEVHRLSIAMRCHALVEALGTETDGRERKRLEKKLEQLERRLRTTLEQQERSFQTSQTNSPGPRFDQRAPAPSRRTRPKVRCARARSTGRTRCACIRRRRSDGSCRPGSTPPASPTTRSWRGCVARS